MPVGWNLDDARVLPSTHGHHPRLGVFLGVGFLPRIRIDVREIVWLEVVVHEGMVVLNAKLLQEFDAFTRRCPSRGGPPSRLFAHERRKDIDGPGENITLLLFVKSRHKFVRVPV